MTKKKRQKAGPKPDRVKIDENWEDAMGRALKKKRPQEGWPDPENDKEDKPEK